MRIDLRHTRRLLAQQPIDHPQFIILLTLDMLREPKIKRVTGLRDVPINIVQKARPILHIDSLESAWLQPPNEAGVMLLASSATQVYAWLHESP